MYSARYFGLPMEWEAQTHGDACEQVTSIQAHFPLTITIMVTWMNEEECCFTTACIFVGLQHPLAGPVACIECTHTRPMLSVL